LDISVSVVFCSVPLSILEFPNILTSIITGEEPFFPQEVIKEDKRRIEMSMMSRFFTWFLFDKF
jgi:hypothetical protein